MADKLLPIHPLPTTAYITKRAARNDTPYETQEKKRLLPCQRYKSMEVGAKRADADFAAFLPDR